ncbi:MAG TPA: Gfo/Idh/MocA family oxidoreductase [Chryseolinea sp.]
MSRKIRWGIMGSGNIANKFADDLRWVEDAELMAVGSRDHQKAIEFAARHNSKLAFGTYEELVSCPEVDVVYVATPHGLHREHAMLCIQHKKAVLCEKAFALNSFDAAAMIEAAKKNKVFIMEAFWTKFIPQYEKVESLIQSGAIGQIKFIQADFGFKASTPPAPRLYEPHLGGGALLDIGIYPVFLAISLLGRPGEVFATMKPFSTGVDQQIAIALKFETGALASLSATFEAATPVEATISGDDGCIRMTNRFHNPTGNVALTRNLLPVEIGSIHREQGHGYQFEARHVGDCLRKQLLESPVMRHSDTLLLMETLDRIRAVCGIRYPADERK